MRGTKPNDRGYQGAYAPRSPELEMTMSDHAWVQENIESYVAGGLEPAECERLQQHLAACPECTARLAEVGAVDRRLDGLFTQVRPPADMEDRLIQSMR